jgi:hypothetical protein
LYNNHLSISKQTTKLFLKLSSPVVTVMNF